MNTPTLTNLWLLWPWVSILPQIRADFSNDRHHAMSIQKPYGPKELVFALRELADQIEGDPHLREK